jgi:HEXXH motif-containing protein
MPAAWLADRVRAPDEVVAAELAGRDFRFVEGASESRETLLKAAELLATAPTLEAAVAGALGEIVLLAADPGYDISHSEPRWPRTAFLTAASSKDGVLRALENVVHEAMHLQLTTYETSTPLVADMAARMASPWRAEPRQLQGVLHGAYVFRCITAFFGDARLKACLDDRGQAYVSRRAMEISGELETIEFDALDRGLTAAGRAFSDALLRAAPDADERAALASS